MTETIGALVRRLEEDYQSGITHISKYVDFDQYENINKIEAYAYSKHVSGDKDAIGRDKPFFNVVTSAENIWYRATNIPRTKIRVKAPKREQKPLAFIATILLQDWMIKNNFDAFLTKWGRTLSRYGSAVTKWVKKDGKLTPTIESWNKLICDSIDFDANPRIVKMDLTPAQLLKNKNYNKEQVKALLETSQTRTDLDRQNVDNKTGYIPVYEVHGELPLSYLTDNDKDDDEYVQQMSVLSFVAKKDNSNEYDEFVLYRGREKNPHYITHLIEEDSRTQAIGAIEYLFDAQWMVNHSAKQIKDTLDFASLLLLQTSDKKFAGMNALKSLITGNFLITDENSPITQVNNQHDITQIQSFSATWQNLTKEVTSTPDAIRGNTQPSGTAFRSVMIQQQQGQSLFEIMKLNKKRQLEEMIRQFVLPEVIKSMDTSEEIAAVLDSQNISQLEAMYVPNEAIRRDNKQLKKTILSGKIAENLDRNALEQQIKGEMTSLGNQRFFKPSEITTKTWKEALKDFQWDVEIDIEDKETDDQLVAQTFIDLFKTLANPAVQQFITTPQGKFLWQKTLESTNAVSPLEFSQIPDNQLSQPQPSQPVAQPTSLNTQQINA